MTFQARYGDAMRWTGGESAWVGSNPPAGARVIMQANNVVATASAGSLITVSYLTPFPNGIVSLLVSPGDNANSLGFFQVPFSGQTLSAFIAYPWRATPNTSIASLPVRVNYVALGW